MDMVSRIEEVVLPTLAAHGVELVELTLTREYSRQVVRLLVEKEAGKITLDECTALNHRIGTVLDQGGVIQDRYVLEVSSPGIDRPFTQRRDYERALGSMVRIYTREKIDTATTHRGTLAGVDATLIGIVTPEGAGRLIPLDAVVKAHCEIEF